jgi:hypothetical protein
MDLLIRATRNDHTIVDHFLTPTSAAFTSTRQPIGTVVADAQVAVARPQLHKITGDAGVPYVIDPLTPLLQSEQAPIDPWARLPFAHPEPLEVADLSAGMLDELIDRTITFQRELGATELVPPYFYSARRHDAWWQADLAILRRTATYLSEHGIDLPVLPVAALSLPEYGPRSTWTKGIDEYLDATKALNVTRVALSWSWSNPAVATDARIGLLLGATRHAAERVPVVGWRSGAFGVAMTAVGAMGYETGIGSRESLHYVALANSRKPRDRRGGGGQAYVYLTEFGRSVPRRVGEALLAAPAIAGSLLCDPTNMCCPDGATSMRDAWREHAVRERRRELDQIAAIPPSLSWRLNHVGQRAERARTLAVTANEILERRRVPGRLPVDTFAALQRVTSTMRDEAARRAA